MTAAHPGGPHEGELEPEGCRPRHAWRQIGVWEAGAPMKKYLTWALGAFVVFYLLNSPTGAAHVLHNALSTLTSAGNSLSRFVNAL